MSIYQEIILDHYHKPHNHGTLASPSADVTVSNSSCGDTIRMMLIVANNIVEDVAFSGDGCAITVASASMLSDAIKGKPVDDIMSMTRDDILALLGITLTPNRLRCALLPLEGVQKALRDVDST